jgi:hypothetical protein
MKPLSISMITNMALVEAWDCGAPINAVECGNWFDLEANTEVYRFVFGPSKYLSNRIVMRTSEIYARAWDECEMKPNGLVFTIIILESLAEMLISDVRRVIGDEVRAVLFNLHALRVAG